MKLPVFPNWYPYNDMLLDGHLQVGDRHVKTRSYDWNYRGPVLLYNSGRVAWPCVNAYGYPSAKRPHRLIVGVATLEDVRPLTERELWKMDRNFNNLTSRQMHEHPERIEIYAFEIGYFFVNPIRFETPVPFAWPPGPLKPIFTEIRPGSAIGRQLRAAGIRAAA